MPSSGRCLVLAAVHDVPAAAADVPAAAADVCEAQDIP